MRARGKSVSSNSRPDCAIAWGRDGKRDLAVGGDFPWSRIADLWVTTKVARLKMKNEDNAFITGTISVWRQPKSE